MKVLNLYSGIGGNRKLWKDVEVTAVENNKEIAGIYQDFFPEDKVIVADAHQYLLENYKEFDFIWSSPPCPTHSEMRRCGVYRGQYEAKYPNMKLYEEIIMLQYFSRCPWVIENVRSYYEPLIKPYEVHRHYFWSNFEISFFKTYRNFNIVKARSSTIENSEEDISELEEYHGIKLPKDTKNKRLLLRNCVNPKIGLHILKESQKEQQTLIPPPNVIN